MTKTETASRTYQMQVLTAQGSWVNYGRPKTVEQRDAIRATLLGMEGVHYRFKP